MTDVIIATLLAVTLLAICAAGYRWGRAGVAAVVGLALLVVGVVARRRPSPAIAHPPRVDVDPRRELYRQAEVTHVEAVAKMEALRTPAPPDEVAARRAAREAEVRRRGGQ